jgi:hypothetical protein
MSADEPVEVTVRYADMEVRFAGSAASVTRGFLDFMNKILPSYALLARLTLSVDLEKLLTDLEGVLAITPEGVIVTVPTDRLGERDALLLFLVKAKVTYQLGKGEKDHLTIAQLMTLTKGKPSSTAARLSELVNLGWVDRVGRGLYRITTYGTVQFVDALLPKIHDLR